MRYMMANQNQMGQSPKGGQEMIKGEGLSFSRTPTPREMMMGGFNNNPAIRSTGNMSNDQMMGNMLSQGAGMAGRMNYNPMRFSPSTAGQAMKGGGFK